MLAVLEKPPIIKPTIISAEELLTSSKNLQNGLPLELVKLLEPLIQDMFECTHSIINARNSEDLEEFIKNILPQFTAIRIEFLWTIFIRPDAKSIFEWSKQNLDSSRKLTLHKLQKTPEKERIHEKIRLFFALSKSVSNISFNFTKEIAREDALSLLQLFSIDTYFILLLYSLLEAESTEILPFVHHKLAEMFCHTFTQYRKIVEPLVRKWGKPDYSHLPPEKLWKGRPLVRLEDLKECPFPPEPELQEWEKEWSQEN
jgi:hypothetical protein